MSETIIVKKKKKKTDFELLRKLEDEYDEAVEDAERKEEILIKKVHNEYLNAERKGEFFEKLKKSDKWYYNKFEEYRLPRAFPEKSSANIEVHQERKKQQILNDLDEMKEDIESIPVVEIDETLIDETDYVDPREEKLDWIEKTKSKIADTEVKEIVTHSNFGRYQETKTAIKKMILLKKSDFNVSNEYRNILIHELKKSINYLNELLREIE